MIQACLNRIIVSRMSEVIVSLSSVLVRLHLEHEVPSILIEEGHGPLLIVIANIIQNFKICKELFIHHLILSSQQLCEVLLLSHLTDEETEVKRS